jgi:ArsR family transcriptional regulator, zinc-responsive transcriptional repressor
MLYCNIAIVRYNTGMKAINNTKLLDVGTLQEAAECLRTLAHPVRLRMVQLMLQGKLTVGEIAQACEIPSHMASEHLRMMQHCGLLARRQDGRRIYYQVSEPTVERLMECIERRFGDDEHKKEECLP